MRLPLPEVEPPRPVIRTRHGDAAQLCREWPSSPWDLVLTDPAYPSLQRHRDAGGSTVRLQDWFEVMSYRQILDVLTFVGLGLRPGAFALVMADWTTALTLAQFDGVDFSTLEGTQAPLGHSTGLRWRTPWAWVKTRKDGQPACGMGYYGRGAYELVLVLQKLGDVHPDTAAALRRRPNVVITPRVRGGYPTEKPVELGVQLISAFAPWATRVLDPFAGSGWAGAAALECGGGAELWDVNPDAPVHTREWPAFAQVVRG